MRHLKKIKKGVYKLRPARRPRPDRAQVDLLPCKGCTGNVRLKVPKQTLPPVHNLVAVSCFFNPAGYLRPLQNARQFLAAAQAWPIPLYLAEVAFDRQPFQFPAAYLQIRASSARHAMWQKERLLNRIVETLPPAVEAVAWIDADLLFLNRHWPEQAQAALRQYPVVQPWTSGRPTTANGHLGKHFQSVGAGGNHPGWAWAARRELFPLYDAHIAGSGDTMMSYAWTQRKCPNFRPSGITSMNPTWLAAYERYEARAWAQVQGRIGAIPGELVHLYHGEAKDRHYWDRWETLKRHDYDPDRDIRLDPDTGLWEWSSDKPEMHKALREYPRQRNEDVGL